MAKEKSGRRLLRTLPLPELIERKAARKLFKVRQPQGDETPHMNAKLGVMAVPIDDRPEAKWIRRHEMGHLAWSPVVPPMLDDQLLQNCILACEDARIQHLLKRGGFDTTTHRRPGEITSRMLLFDVSKADLTLTRICTAATSSESETARLLSTNVKLAALANDTLRKIRQNLDSFDNLKAAATDLAKALRTDGYREAVSKIPPISIVGSTRDDEDEESDGDTDSPETLSNIPFTSYPKTEDGESKMPSIWSMPSRDVRWGRMVIAAPTLTRRLPAAVGRGKWRPADMGAVPRRMERWTSDQAVFSTRGKKRGGTILIDASGSMHIVSEMIEACLASAPAATLAMYWGRDRDGTLMILAARGRRVAAVPRRDGVGNIIDGPALRWLSTQKAPRIWVCDEDVSGVGDTGSSILRDECRGICSAFGIKRVDRLSDAARLLRLNH